MSAYSAYDMCKACGAQLFADDIAIHRKLVERGAKAFFCIDCLAERLGCTRKDIEDLIAHYRKTKECTLFV